MKIVTIVGARPQFIKAAAVSRAIQNYNGQNNNSIKEIIIHTGQHFDSNMSNVFFEQMGIPKPNYNLDINSLGHGAMTGKMLEGIEKILIDEMPNYVLVYGDTNSTIAGALAAKKLNIKVIHVEAGLRSFNMEMPEEINRILTDRISDILFCPTDAAVNNLQKEGYGELGIKIVKNGDVMQDAALFYSERAESPNINLPENFILATIHRQENTDDKDKLLTIFESFEKISETIPIVMPIHPRTRKLINVLNMSLKNVILIDPVGYLQMVYLLKNCSLVMTDSGGLQKEAFFFEKYCITLREQTEWVELVENGFNKLVNIDSKSIIESVKDIPFKLDFTIDLYGKGVAAKNIVNNIMIQQ